MDAFHRPAELRSDLAAVPVAQLVAMIDWEPLLAPLDRLAAEGALEGGPRMREVARLVVTRLLASAPPEGLRAIGDVPSGVGVDGPGEDEIVGLAARLESLGQVDPLRARLETQLRPWRDHLSAHPGAEPSVIARRLLPADRAATDWLLAELARSALERAPTTAASLTSWRLPVPPLAARVLDAALGLAWTLAYESARLAYRAARATGVGRLLARAERASALRKPRDRQRLIELGLPPFDAALRSLLRGASRTVAGAAQRDDPALLSGFQRACMRSLGPLIGLRAKLWMAAGDYPAAFAFRLARAAWEPGPSPVGLEHAGFVALLAGRHDRAVVLLRAAVRFGSLNSSIHAALGQSLLALGRDAEARDGLRRAAGLHPSHFMAHQNLAGMYDGGSYRCHPFDIAGHPEALLVDAHNLLGERLVHIGEGERGVVHYGAALRLQASIAVGTHLPFEVRRLLADRHGLDGDEPIRILPYEWVTLIGHIAMLDSYLKIRRLGFGPPGRPLLLAPPAKVANASYLDLWRRHVTVIDDPWLVDQIFPYQRAWGDCFNGWLRPDGTAGDWTQLGALAQHAWGAAGQGPLLEIPEALLAFGRRTLAALGLGEGDWFVALHVRGTGFHREGKRSMQTHRNAALEDYVPAIRAITDAGGWVIRMGDASMERLPPMNRVIDYPHTPSKSARADIALLAMARFFVGTTSGLMNVVSSLGTPCLLVNCVSNYFQLWNDRVLYALKPFWHRGEGRFLTLGEMVSERLRWKVFNINRLEAMGIEPRPNDPDVIEAAVREMMARMEGGPVLEETAADAAVAAECARGGNPFFFGGGRMSQSFYERHRDALVAR